MNQSEDGSIAPLILAYFSLAMAAIFLISNIASVYVARRDLINITESALSKAAQELDEFVYYYRIPISEIFGDENQRVPINCSDAGVTLQREIELASRQIVSGIGEDNFEKFSDVETPKGVNYAETLSGENEGQSYEVSNSQYFNNNREPRITYFGCNGTVLQAKVRQEHLLPFALNVFGIKSYVNEVTVSVEARFS
jgi:hypothetical protein